MSKGLYFPKGGELSSYVLCKHSSKRNKGLCYLCFFYNILIFRGYFMKKWLSLFRTSLKWKAVLIFFLLLVLPTFIIGFIVSFQSSNVLKHQVLETTHRNIKNMESNLIAAIDEVEEISRYIIFSGEFQNFFKSEFHEFMSYDAGGGKKYEELTQLRSNISGFFTFHLSDKEYFSSIEIEGQNGEHLAVGEPMYGDETVWINKAIRGRGDIIWSDPYFMTSGWQNDDKEVITLFRVINDIHQIKEPIGRVKIRLDIHKLFDSVTEGLIADQQEAFILYNDGKVIVDEDLPKEAHTYIDKELKTKINRNSDYFKFKSKRKTYYGISNYIADVNLHLVTVTDEDYISSETAGIRKTFQYLIIFIVSIGIFIFAGFVITIIRPILELTNETKRLETGDFKARVSLRTSDEIGQLGYRFNNMVSQIEWLIDTKYKLKIQNKQSELNALQAQINPHFLYNTLDMIRWTARMEQAEETGRSIEDLSRLFRNNLSQVKVWIPLKAEMKYVQSYLELQKRRMGGELDFLVLMEEGLENCLTMKQILEPLVENCIKHAFKRTECEKRIRIRAYYDLDSVFIDVIDNGLGMNVDRINTSLEKGLKTDHQEGIGLQNTHVRLVTAFGKRYGLKIMPMNQGSLVRIRLPYIENEDKLKHILESGENTNGD